MSIAGISSNFSAVNTTDVQAAQQFSEDEQLLSETLQTQSLTNTTLTNTSALLSSLQPTLNTTLTALNPPGGETNLSGGLVTALDGNTATAGNAGSGVEGGANNGIQTNNTGNTTQTTATQPGALQSLAQTIRARAQQAYTTAQQGFPRAGSTTLGTTGAIVG